MERKEAGGGGFRGERRGKGERMTERGKGGLGEGKKYEGEKEQGGKGVKERRVACSAQRSIQL